MGEVVNMNFTNRHPANPRLAGRLVVERVTSINNGCDIPATTKRRPRLSLIKRDRSDDFPEREELIKIAAEAMFDYYDTSSRSGRIGLPNEELSELEKRQYLCLSRLDLREQEIATSRFEAMLDPPEAG